MQEGTTMQWNPMYEGQLPWSTRLFVFYLLVVLLVCCFRASRIFWQLRNLRKGTHTANGFRHARDSCHARMVSIKNWAAMTFLLSFLVCSWRTAETLSGISAEKVTGTSFLAGATAEVLMTFCLGILVCSILYAVAFFCETLLARNKSQQRSDDKC